MIRSIPKITSFGVFDNFHWPTGIPEFKQYNLIYGWNYSGKTTLARAFRCFEEKHPHVDFAGAEVQLQADNGTIHNLSAPHSAPIFSVFNSDFVRDNLSFADGSAAPILVLGIEDIAKQEALIKKKSDRDKLFEISESDKNKRETKKLTIDKALTQYARDFIKNSLSFPNYDKTRFEPKVIECKSEHEKYLLSDDELNENLVVYRSTDKKPTLQIKSVSLASITELSEMTASLLARVVTACNPIPRLKEDPIIETWVNEGRSLHIGKDTCQFCGQPLPVDLITNLTCHFSADYEDLMTKLRALLKTVKAAQEEDVPLDHKNDFYAEYVGDFIAEKSKLEELLKSRKSALGRLAEALTDKQTKAFTNLECPVVNEQTEQIAIVVEAINKIVTDHNNRTAEFDKKRQEAFTKIEKHYAASFVRDQEYNQQLQDIADLEKTIDVQVKTLDELDRDVRGLEQELSEAAKGAGRINELLAAYFGRDDICVVVSKEKQFQIVRNGVVAKNLSEGEKTAIAFAYFITRVQDGRHPLEDTRIVIDDPVSSLDANHLFNTYALIKTQLSGCRQLFISTHSFEFYNLIREWIADEEKDTKKPQADWKKWSVFLIRRTDDGKAVLEEIPKELLKFKSEYHYLFSTLYHFDKAGAGRFDCLLSLPNVVRRFLEAFGGVMIPLSTGLRGKMERIFTEEVARERVWKFINHYSHQTTITRSLTIPDTSECHAVVNACLKAVHDWDEDYFKDLETEVS